MNSSKPNEKKKKNEKFKFTLSISASNELFCEFKTTIVILTTSVHRC